MVQAHLEALFQLECQPQQCGWHFSFLPATKLRRPGGHRRFEIRCIRCLAKIPQNSRNPHGCQRPCLPDATLKAYSTIGFIKPLNAQPTMPPMMPSCAPHCAKAMPARTNIAVHIPHASTNTPQPQPHPVTANRPPAGRRRPGFSDRGRKGRSSCPCMPCRASWRIRRGRTRRSPATG